MFVYKPEGAKVPIKVWMDKDSYYADDGMVEQLENVSKLPFIFHHVALSPDGHFGYGVPIGGVGATEGYIVPNFVGKDIGCGMQFVKTSIDVGELDSTILKKIMAEIRKVVPVGFKKHDKPQPVNYMPQVEEDSYFALSSHNLKTLEKTHPIAYNELENAMLSLGTLGGGNHFIEIQETDDDKVGIMIHSGSRNLGLKIADHYNNIAIELNQKWHSSVPKEWQLAFLPLDSEEGQAYLREMNYALDFAKGNRHLMMRRVKEVFEHMCCTQTDIGEFHFEDSVEIHHNFARMENHFGKNVMVHRKGATSAKEGELGIIPGSQGSASYLVRGKGNKESFMSCSHGAGRQMGRKQAQRTLVLADEIKKLDDLGVIHAIRTVDDLDEASGAYKDISVVMKEQEDLVDIVHELKPLGVIKG